jgi:predicted nicotinamide N-methyase
VIASQELYKHREVAVEKQSILILGAGVGLEAQASALFGAKEVLATDIHPTTLQQLRFGVEQEEAISDKTIVETKILDLFAHEDQPIPTCDTMIIADVLYNELLASQVALRIVEAWLLNPKIHILVTDSQRFVPTFVQELNELLESAGGPSVEWEEQTLKSFTGSGVCIDDDQTYDIIVRKMWMGL